MVLDTACQRTCCSTKWYEEWSYKASKKKLQAREVPSREPFEFGHGPTQYSHKHVYLPTGFDFSKTSTCLIGASVINTTNDIPLLGSCNLMKKLGAIIDLPKQEVRFQKLKCQVLLKIVSGHLAVNISQFPKDICKQHELWQILPTCQMRVMQILS